jgi:hypothetical protein
MGSETFFTKSHANSPKTAFQKAVKEAEHDYGHSGYTGTIAEKDSYQMASYACLTLSEAQQLADSLINTPPYSDKWGPAGCLRVSDDPKIYLFFGWASS